MGNSSTQSDPAKVALRKESVDRNANPGVDLAVDWLSLSARRGGLVLCNRWDWFFTGTVALRKESVDRNIKSLMAL